MDRYKIIKWPNGLLWLEFEAKNVEEGLLIAKEKLIDNFICDFHPTDNITDLSFLNSTIVKGLNVTFSGLKSNAELNEFNNLRILLSLFGKPVTLLDFSKLTKIEELEITYNNKVDGLSKLVNLRELRLWKYMPRTKDLVEFRGYSKVKKILLVQPVIESLDGIQELHQLNTLEIVKPKGLKYFFKTTHKKYLENIERLSFSFCKDFDFESMPVLKNVNSFSIADNGTIKTLETILQKIPNLKLLFFTRTELLDGNLDYLLDHPTLEKVAIDHKKLYNKKEKEINAILTEKRNKK